MSPQPPNPAETLQGKLDDLERLVKNCLIENTNFKPVDLGNGRLADGVYFTHYPTTRSFVEGPLRAQSSVILDQISELRSLAAKLSKADATSELLVAS